MITRRRIIAATGLAAAAAILPAAVRSQVLAKPARMLVGYPPGGSIDAIGRIIADKMRGSYAPAVVVENRPGNRGVPVMAGVMNAPADGSTFLIAPHSMNILWPHVYAKLPYDPINDLIPVSTIHLVDFAFVVRAGIPVTNLAQYINWVKSDPKQNGLFGITGAQGGTPHFLGMLFAQSVGIQMTPVPYKGVVQGIQDLLGGQTFAWMGPLGDIERFHRAGKVRILASTGPKQSHFMPDVPSFTDQGYPSVVAQERFGIYLRAGAAPSVVQALNRSIRDALESPDVKAMCEKFTSLASGSTPAEFDAIIRREFERWRGIVKAAGYTPED